MVGCGERIFGFEFGHFGSINRLNKRKLKIVVIIYTVDNIDMGPRKIPLSVCLLWPRCFIFNYLKFVLRVNGNTSFFELWEFSVAHLSSSAELLLV